MPQNPQDDHHQSNQTDHQFHQLPHVVPFNQLSQPLPHLHQLLAHHHPEEFHIHQFAQIPHVHVLNQAHQLPQLPHGFVHTIAVQFPQIPPFHQFKTHQLDHESHQFTVDQPHQPHQPHQLKLSCQLLQFHKTHPHAPHSPDQANQLFHHFPPDQAPTHATNAQPIHHTIVLLYQAPVIMISFTSL